MEATVARKLTIDPEFRSLIPPLSPNELQQLEVNILADGCRDPLAAWLQKPTRETTTSDCECEPPKWVREEYRDGPEDTRGPAWRCAECGAWDFDDDAILLDGHNRYTICDRHGVAYDTIDVPGVTTRDEAKRWIILNQRGRRNLSDSQWAMLAAKLANLEHGQKKSDTAIAVSQSEASELFGVSVDSVQRARVVQEQGTPELIAAVEADKISVSTAAEIATLPADEQSAVLKLDGKGIVAKSRAVKSKRKAKKKAAKKAAKIAPTAPSDAPESDRFRLIHADVTDLTSHIEPDSIDWIITDPPYPKEYLGVYAGLAALASKVLKPGGSLLAMVGQSYLPEIIAALAGELRYQWALAYLTPGGQSVQLWDRKVNTFWKPVLWFVKGEYKGDWIGDVCRSDVNDNDKHHHRWGQSESGMDDLLDRFTYPGQIILDPFLGGGTTGVVAVGTGRKFIGADVDAEAIATARARMVEVSE